MESIYQWGINIIKGIQGFENPALMAIMRGLTFSGTSNIYFGLVLLLYWCIDEKKGFRLGILLVFSAWVTAVCKMAFKQPRPFQLDTSVGMAYEPTYGFPSGHALNSLVAWMVIASWGKRKILYLGAAVISLLIGFSRLYLGVHFPTDLFGGWLIALIILGAYFFLSDSLVSLLVNKGLRWQMIFSCAVALIMLNVRSGDVAIDTTLSGVVLGIGIGYSLMLKHVRFSAKSVVPKMGKRILFLALRFFLGIAGAALIFKGFALFMPAETSAHFRLTNFCRYAILGIWIYTGAPWLFLRLRLAEEASPQ